MALITDLGNAPNIVAGIFMPKLRNRFQVTFIGVGATNSDGEPLQAQVITCDRPKLSFEKITLDRYNSRAYIAGKYTWEPINIVFEDDTGGLVSTAVQNQLEKQENIIAVASSPMLPASPAGELYKFVTRIDMLDGNDTIYESWSVEGCWIQSLDPGSLDYAASETVKISLQLTFDHARQLITGVEYRANGVYGAF
jgi:hypothetical protein